MTTEAKPSIPTSFPKLSPNHFVARLTEAFRTILENRKPDITFQITVPKNMYDPATFVQMFPSILINNINSPQEAQEKVFSRQTQDAIIEVPLDFIDGKENMAQLEETNWDVMTYILVSQMRKVIAGQFLGEDGKSVVLKGSCVDGCVPYATTESDGCIALDWRKNPLA